MKALILTYGTQGDVQPFVALAKALNEAGHEAVLGAPAESSALMHGHGIQHVPLNSSSNSLINDPIIREAIETNYRGVRGKRIALQASRRTRTAIAGMLDTMYQLAKSGADIVVHNAITPGHHIGELLGVPSFPVCLQPFWVPTDSFPHPAFPFPLPAAFNRVSFGWLKVLELVFGVRTQQWRRETLGLPRRRGQQNILRRPDGTPSTVLQAVSRHILPSPLRYPEWVHTTGFWFPPRPAKEWENHQTVSDFLGAGDPPVYIGFGSMVGTAPERLGHIIVEAIRLARVRAIVVAGWGGIQTHDLGDNVLCLNDAPFDWLLPRTAAVVHHGGSGTTGAALASGRPQVVCPFILDQQFFARRAHASGVATAPLPKRQLTPEGLAAAIRLAVSDRAMAARADELGHLVRSEDGLRTTIKILESVK